MCVCVFRKGKNERQFGKNYKKVPFDRNILLWGYTNTEIIRQVHIATKSAYTTKTLCNFVKLLLLEHTPQMWQVL